MGGSPVRAIARIVKPTPPPAPVTVAPTTAEVSQATAQTCLLYTSPSPRDRTRSRMPSSA